MNYFEQQQDNRLLTSEDVTEMKGKPLYGEYEEGDKVYYIMIQETHEKITKNKDIYPSIDIRIKPIVERTLEKLYNEYNFVRMATKFPVFEKKTV